MIIKTGYGYIKDLDGNIVAKYDLPVGEHKESKGYTYHEVNTKKDLENIVVHREPESKEHKAKKENRASAKGKLVALGLTDDEASEIIGGSLI